MGRLVGYVFQSVGRRRIGEDDWVRILSFERKWMPPQRARALAGVARAEGLLRNAGERDFEMGLEAEGLDLPLDYRPEASVVSLGGAGAPTEAEPALAREPTLPLFRRIIRRTAAATGETETAVVGRVNAHQATSGGLWTAEAAALYDAALHGVDAREFLDEAEARVRPVRSTGTTAPEATGRR